MATEAEVKRALTQIRPDENVTVRLKDGTEFDGQLVRTDGDKVHLSDNDGDIALADVESIVTVVESDGPE